MKRPRKLTKMPINQWWQLTENRKGKYSISRHTTSKGRATDSSKRNTRTLDGVETFKSCVRQKYKRFMGSFRYEIVKLYLNLTDAF